MSPLGKMATGALLAALTGCGVPFGAALEAGPVNTCSSNADCAATGAACAQGVCVATQYDLTGMFLEVQPTAGASFGAGLSFIVPPGSLSLSSNGKNAAPFAANVPLTLPQLIPIQKAKVTLAGAAAAQCPAAAQGVPAAITFYPKPSFVGLPADPIVVGTSGAEPSFGIGLLSGSYDVYVVPQAIMGCPAYPPMFTPDVTIDTPISAGVQALPASRTYTANITGLTNPALWKADLVEPMYGLPISGSVTLSAPAGDPVVTAQITTWTTAYQPILRVSAVSPSVSGAPLPTLYWDLTGAIFVDTASGPMISVGAEGLIVKGVSVGGQVLAADGRTGAQAQLVFQSTSLKGADAQNAAFTLAGVSTGPDGSYSAKLPPGDYTVVVVPSDPSLSVGSFQLPWPANVNETDGCVCGRPFQLSSKDSVGGRVQTASGQPVANTFVGVTPTPAAARSYFVNTHSLDPLATRPVSTNTDGSGGFSLLVDRGTSQLSVQPDPSTDLPWLVLPRLPSDATSSSLTLTTPAFLSGTVVDPYGMPVADATVGAWFPVPDSGTPTVVQIAKTSTDQNGAFTLILPSSI